MNLGFGRIHNPWSRATKKLQELRYHPTQYRYVNEPVRFKVAAAGRRSGKTELAKRKILAEASRARRHHCEECWESRLVRFRRWGIVVADWDCDCNTWFEPPYRYFFGAPTHDQARRYIWPFLEAYISVDDMFEPPNRSDWEFKVWAPIEGPGGVDLGRFDDRGFPSYSIIRCVSMDRPDRFEGDPWDGGVLDEYANMKENVWNQHVFPALMDRRAWCDMIGVPEGMNHYKEKFDMAQSHPDTWASYSWPSADILPEAEVEMARQQLDDRTFRQEFLASFEAQTGRVYYAFDQRLDSHEFPMPDYVGDPDGPSPLFIGVDFNVHPMTAVVGYNDVLVDGQHHTFIIHEFSLDISNTYELRDSILGGLCSCCQGRHGLSFFPSIVYPDASGKHASTSTKKGVTDHQILREGGFNVISHTRNPMRRDRFNATNTRFCSGAGDRRTHIHPRCTKLIRSLNGLLFDEHGEPDKKSGFDHITDAFSYAIEHQFPIVVGEVRGMKW